MITRDSKLWAWLIAGAVLTALGSNLNLIDPLIPASTHTQVHAGINLASLLVATVAGILRSSPLGISDQGRAAYMGSVPPPKDQP